MIKAFAKVTKTKDLSKQVEQSLKSLANQEVYVGIPEGDVGDHKGITNPQLMYILTHGVRNKSMRDEMGEYMGLTSSGMPIMRDWNKFSKHMDQGMPYSAAYDMYIHEHGSALWHTPPRPILEPAISRNKDKIAPYLKSAAQSALNGQDPSPYLQEAGLKGVKSAQDWFFDPENRWPKNAPSTIKKKGSARSNIDTANLRNSITYVVAKKA